jgi:xeroderma pigmentosum group C-complementing protein
LTGQQKTLSKTAENSRKIAKVKTNKRGKSRQTASSIKEDEKNDSDSDQSFKFETRESADSNSENDFQPKKVTKKRRSSDGRLLHRAVLASDAGTGIDEEDAQKKKKKKNRCDVWTEVFLEEEEKWISVDVQRGKVHCVAELHVSLSFSVFTQYV